LADTLAQLYLSQKLKDNFNPFDITVSNEDESITEANNLATFGHRSSL